MLAESHREVFTASLGETAGVSFAWSRPLDRPKSERSEAALRIGEVTGHLLLKPPQRSETVRNLLEAATKLVTRWERLLEKIGRAKEFDPPSFEVPAPEKESHPKWNEDLQSRSWRER